MRAGVDEDSPERKLTCRGGGKMRYDVEPEPVFLRVEPFGAGVVVVVPAPREPTTTTNSPVKDAVKESIRTVMAGQPPASKSDVAVLVGRRLDDYTFKGAWIEMERGGELVPQGQKWVLVSPDAEREATPEEELLVERLFSTTNEEDDDVIARSS